MLFFKIYQFLTSKEKIHLIIILFLMTIGMLLEVMSITMILPIIYFILDTDFRDIYLISSIVEILGNPDRNQLIIFSLLCLTMIFIIKSFFIAFLTWHQSKFAFIFGANLSEKLYQNYLSQNYLAHTEKNTPELIRNMTFEVNMIIGSLSQAMIIIAEAIVVLGVFAVLIIFEPFGTGVIVVFFLFAGSVFYLLTRKTIISWGLERQLQEKYRMQKIQESFSGFKEIKLLNKINFFLRKYVLSNKSLAAVGIKMQTINAIPRLYIESLMVISLTIFLIFIIQSGYSIEQTIGSLTILAAAGFRVLPSANRIYSALQNLNFSSHSVNLISEEIIKNSVSESKINKKKLNFDSQIMLNNIQFKYPSSNKNIFEENINLDIKKGDFIGIVGTSGSGKSTLINLISGLLEPSEGQITVDGIDIQEDLSNWQRQIGYVPQQSYLFNSTIKENIAFGIEESDIDENLMINAIKTAEIEEYVDGLKNGLSTSIGEDGIVMSGGQRQRLTIARAIYHNPSVIIFDEATNALDEKTEREILNTIYNIKSATVILISHNHEILENCDHVYSLSSKVLKKI